MVFPPCLRAPRCAALSIPQAIPLTVTTSFLASRLPILKAVCLPYSLHFRAPTTAAALSLRSEVSPMQYRISRPSSISERNSGKALSPFLITFILFEFFIIIP